jgi:hypothetical protein
MAALLGVESPFATTNKFCRDRRATGTFRKRLSGHGIFI